MKVTSPQETSSANLKLEEAISKFEEQFSNPYNEKDSKYYHLVIEGEYNRTVCDEIEKIYLKAGWSKAICKTSSEKGERPGLTGLQLWI